MSETAEVERERVTLSDYGAGKVGLTGLSGDETEIVQGMVNGCRWVTMKDGRLKSFPVYEVPPAPAEDPETAPFWRRRPRRGGFRGTQHTLFDDDPRRYSTSPHFAIQHLCGYYYTPEGYRAEAEKLESWGFECLRSRRGPSGQFWEIWFLSELWAAKGDLKSAVQGLEGKAAVDTGVSFLCGNASFGTLDVAVQRAAMPVE